MVVVRNPNFLKILLLVSVSYPWAAMAEQTDVERANNQIPGLPKNKSFYMDKVYDVVKLKSGDLKIALNDYLISVQARKVREAAWKPQLAVSASTATSATGGDYNIERKFSTVGLSLTQPILSFGRYYDLKMSKVDVKTAEVLQKIRQKDYLVTYAEAIIAISEAKTAYYFAHEKLLFLESYREKVVGDLEIAHNAKNRELEAAGQPLLPKFNPDNIASLTSLDTEIGNQEIRIADEKTNVQNAINDFRIRFLKAKQFPFEKYNDLVDDAPDFTKIKVSLDHYDPSDLDKVPLPKYLLVNPFVSRVVKYPDSYQTSDLIMTNNLEYQLATQAIEKAQIQSQSAKHAFWPELSLFALMSGTWDQTRAPSVTGIGMHDESTRRDDKIIGIQFTWVIGDGGARQARAKMAELEVQNQIETLATLKGDTVVQAARLHRNIRTIVDNIGAKLKLYAKSKENIQKFLEENIDPAAVNLDKRLIVNDHYALGLSLALLQHEYLTQTLQLLALRNELNPKQFKTFEEDYFVNCTDYGSFVQLRDRL